MSEEKTALECAKKLQDYCSNFNGCYRCIFQDKHGECKVGCPIDWELERR